MERVKDDAPEMTMISKHSRRGSMRWLNMTNVIELLSLGCSNVSAALEKERRRSCSEKDDMPSVSGSSTDGSSEADVGDRECPAAPTSITADDEKLRTFVGTWNVGGRAPHAGLNLRDWLYTPAPADIYVLGFQEVVPLNAGNILVGEDRGPASTWLSLIGQALNVPATASTSAGSAEGATAHPDQFRRPRVSFCDLISIEDMLEEGGDVDSAGEDPEGEEGDRTYSGEEGLDGAKASRRRRGRGEGYRLAASKQMVGIFLCVWIRAHLLPHVRRVKSSCIARGMMGYTGNKGSISISMTLWQTTFCFVCTHLASGEKEKDEVRRNFDVVEILKRTRFSRSKRRALPKELAPKTILEHSKVIWLGDLNYRLSSSCSDVSELLQRNDWGALLEKDQLKNEQKSGRIFTGWHEGKIYFPPTYKYLANSDCYAVQTEETRERRTPAWCDRILWRGEGMKQVCYVRGESMFSDHRPVCSIFSVQLSSVKHDDIAAPSATATRRSGRRKKFYKLKWPARSGHNREASNDHSSSSNSSANSSSRVQAEEMFSITRTENCTKISHL